VRDRDVRKKKRAHDGKYSPPFVASRLDLDDLGNCRVVRDVMCSVSRLCSTRKLRRHRHRHRRRRRRRRPTESRALEGSRSRRIDASPPSARATSVKRKMRNLQPRGYAFELALVHALHLSRSYPSAGRISFSGRIDGSFSFFLSLSLSLLFSLSIYPPSSSTVHCQPRRSKRISLMPPRRLPRLPAIIDPT